MSPAIALAVGGLLSVLVCWVTYLATVPSGKVPERPIGGIVLAVAGMVAAVAGLVLGRAELGAAVIAPSAIAITFAALFLALLTQRRTPIGNIKVKVGDSLLAFESMTSDGAAFDSAAFEGQRTLLKFFRGSW